MPIRTSSSISSTSTRRCRTHSRSSFLALVDGKPRVLNLKEMLEEFLRHRVTVIRRRTQFLLAKARKRKAYRAGLVVSACEHRRGDSSDPRLQDAAGGQASADGNQNARSDAASAPWATKALPSFSRNAAWPRSIRSRPVQADAILKMTLGQLVNLEQEKAGRRTCEAAGGDRRTERDSRRSGEDLRHHSRRLPDR